MIIMSSSQSSTQSKSSSYVVDWDNPSISIKNTDGTINCKKSDFAISLEALVEANDNTGFLADVKRSIDHKRKVCFFTIKSTSFRNKFMAQLNGSFGSGGMTLSLTEPQFCSFIQYLQEEGNSRHLPIKKAACNVGLQPSADVWVLGDNIQISTSGEILDSATSPYILLGKVLARNPAVDIYPHVTMPLCTAPLKHLLSVLQIALRHNFISGLLVVAGSVMALHYSAVVKVNSGCPMVIASGASETGKSTAIKAALSITGAKNGIYAKGTNAFFLKRASMSSLPFAIDDAPKAGKSGGNDISDLVVDLFNGRKTANSKALSLVPLSTAIVASTFDLRKEERVASRAVLIEFNQPAVYPQSLAEEEAFAELEDLVASGRVSSAVGWAIGVGKDLEMKRDVINSLCSKIKGIFSGHCCCKNWAMLLFFVGKLLDEIGQDLLLSVDDVIENIRQHVKPQGGRTGMQLEAVAILHQTVEEILAYIKEMPLREILQFVRCGVEVERKEALAVVLGDAAPCLSLREADIRGALEGKWGETCQKDFLRPSSTICIIQRRKNDRKRRCFAFYLQHLPSQMIQELRRVTSTASKLCGQQEETGNKLTLKTTQGTGQDTAEETWQEETAQLETVQETTQLSSKDTQQAGVSQATARTRSKSKRSREALLFDGLYEPCGEKKSEVSSG